MKNLLIALFLLCTKPFLYAQTYEYTRQVTPEEKKNYLGLNKRMFELSSYFSTSISDADTEMSIKDIRDQVQYNKPYLEKIQAILKKDSLNPYYLNDMAMYHEVNDNPVLAKKYFDKAMKNLPYLMQKKKDSARFYSLRALIKVHLREKEPMRDMEKALKINPLDSLANAFYPIFLIGERKFDEMRQFSIKKLDANELPKLYYVMLFSSYLGDIQGLVSDETKRKANKTKEYDQLLDYTLLNTYAEKYKDNVYVQNARYMVEVSAIFFKMFSFDLNEDESAFVLNFSEKEKKKMAELTKVFNERLANGKINAFTANKFLSLLYFMQSNPDKVLECGKKAVAVLPLNKQLPNFNNTDTYDLILTVYNNKKNYPEYKKTLEEKIAKAYDKSGLANDYVNMSIVYLYQNDIEKADEWCKKSKAINAEEFKCLRLLSHLYFMNDNLSLCQYYGDTAAKFLETNEQGAWLNLQFAINMAIMGDPATAKTAYESAVAAKKAMEGKCPVCDELLAKYITVKP